MHARTLLSHYGYLGILIALSLEYLFIPFPAETILILAGAMWHQGVFAFWPLVLIATVGAFIGSWLGYFIGAWLGRPMLLRFGKYVRLTEKKIAASGTAVFSFCDFSFVIWSMDCRCTCHRHVYRWSQCDESLALSADHLDFVRFV